MKTNKTKKGLVLGLSTVMVGLSVLVASSTATASMSASSSGSECTGPKKEDNGGGTYCECANSAPCCDLSGCTCGDDGGGGGLGGLIEFLKKILK